MYTGELIDDLMDMVARAESRAAHRMVAAPEPIEAFEVWAPRYLYDTPAPQPFLIGVA